MENLPKDKTESISDHLPIALGRAAIDVCLSSFPFALAAINLAGTLGEKYVSLRNENQVKELLESLKQKIDHLNKENILIKDRLKQNVAYQEVAHKRLLSISALDTIEDLDLSASLIALCGTLSGENPKDKYLLAALGDITVDELKIFMLGKNKRSQFEKQKSESEYAGKDAHVEREIMNKISIEFFDEGEELLGLYDFTYLLVRLHSFGLIKAAKIDGFSSYDRTPKVYPPELTPIGDYFVAQLQRVGLT